MNHPGYSGQGKSAGNGEQDYDLTTKDTKTRDLACRLENRRTREKPQEPASLTAKTAFDTVTTFQKSEMSSVPRIAI
jgi:hypothetical protein